MKAFFTIPYLVSILLSLVMALIFRKYLGSRRLLILIPFLFYVFIQETTLWLEQQLGHNMSNAVWYNIYRPISVLVFCWIYYHIPFMRTVRKLILAITIFFLAFALVNYIFIESIFVTSSYLALARGYLITLYGILFLFRYFHLDNAADERYWRPLLWITAGIVIFYPVTSISLNFQKYLAEHTATINGLKLYQVIPQVMSIFMYACFSYAFYLCKKVIRTT
jgi:hypothetical protein